MPPGRGNRPAWRSHDLTHRTRISDPVAITRPSRDSGDTSVPKHSRMGAELVGRPIVVSLVRIAAQIRHSWQLRADMLGEKRLVITPAGPRF